jgi:hypothetical protein
MDDICAALGLGVPGGPPEPVTGGSSAAAWRVNTARGRWLVKTMPPPAAWQLHEMRVSGQLERAAYEAGVPMPEPAEPAVRADRADRRLSPGWSEGCWVTSLTSCG